MKPFFCLLAFVCALHAPAFAVAPALAVEKVPVTITATLAKQKFGADEPVNLTVVLENKSDQRINLGTGADKFSLFDLKLWGQKDLPNANGTQREVARTAFGEGCFTPMVNVFGNAGIYLPPKGKQTIVFPLRRMFDLSLGGRFSFRLARRFPIEWVSTGDSSYREETETKTAPISSFSIEPDASLQMKISPEPNNGF